MEDLAVLTPSFRGDARLFADLHESVLTHTRPSVVHHVVVPPSDAGLFRQYEGPRCRVLTHRELLPRRFLSVSHASGLTLNVRRPWPPVRGWVTQQLMKLAGTAALDARAVVLIDSDAVLMRDVTLDDLCVDGHPWYFRRDDAVTATMTRHLAWDRVARRLLGVPGAAPVPAADYVSPIAVWDPDVVRALTRRIAKSTGRDWIDAVAGELHVSEFVLYGIFADHVHGALATYSRPLCHNYYERVPLTPVGGHAFADDMPRDALGAMISSHSRTPRDVRLDAFRRCAEGVAERSRQAFDPSPRAPRARWPFADNRCWDAAVLLMQVLPIMSAGCV